MMDVNGREWTGWQTTIAGLRDLRSACRVALPGPASVSDGRVAPVPASYRAVDSRARSISGVVL